MSGINLSPNCRDFFQIVAAIIGLGQGRSNAVGEVTLRANQITTVVTKAVSPGAVNVAAGAKVQLTAMTANAAAANTNAFVSSVGQGTFTVTHSSNAQTDRKFGWTAIGG